MDDTGQGEPEHLGEPSTCPTTVISKANDIFGNTELPDEEFVSIVAVDVDDAVGVVPGGQEREASFSSAMA